MFIIVSQTFFDIHVKYVVLDDRAKLIKFPMTPMCKISFKVFTLHEVTAKIPLFLSPRSYYEETIRRSYSRVEPGGVLFLSGLIVGGAMSATP